MTFSEKIKNLRLEASLTQQQLSNYLGITASAIGYLENGQRDPTGSTLVAYARYFNVSIDSLVGLTPDIEDPFSLPKKNLAAPNFTLTEQLSADERRLLEVFRQLNTKNRLHVATYAEVRLEDQNDDARLRG